MFPLPNLTRKELIPLKWSCYKESRLFHENKSCAIHCCNYRKISNIRGTQFQNSTDSRLALQLSLPNLLQPGVKSGMKMWLEQRRPIKVRLILEVWRYMSNSLFIFMTSLALRCLHYREIVVDWYRLFCKASQCLSTQQPINSEHVIDASPHFKISYSIWNMNFFSSRLELFLY